MLSEAAKSCSAGESRVPDAPSEAERGPQTCAHNVSVQTRQEEIRAIRCQHAQRTRVVGSRRWAVCEAYACWRLEQDASSQLPELNGDALESAVGMLVVEQRAAAGGGGSKGLGCGGFAKPWTYVEDACLLRLADGLGRSMPLLAICRYAAEILPSRTAKQAQAKG